MPDPAGPGAAEQPTRTPGVESARRALTILLSFSEEQPELTVDRLAAEHGISTPSAYRYISLLRELYLVEERTKGTFVLAPTILRLFAAAESSLDITAAAKPVLERLRDETGEAALVMRRVHDAAVCVAIENPNRALTLSFVPGQRMPMFGGAGAKVLLAGMPAQERTSLIASLPAQRQGELADAVELIHEAGFAESEGEVDEGVWAIAAPILVGGKTVASLSVATAAFRTAPESRGRIRDLVQEAAVEISAKLLALQSPREQPQLTG
jgi:DNA-binding IclR family transcriptional regulator